MTSVRNSFGRPPSRDSFDPRALPKGIKGGLGSSRKKREEKMKDVFAVDFTKPWKPKK